MGIRNRVATCLVIAGLASLAGGCQFSPTAPFSGFDQQGSRIVGQFESPDGGATAATTGAAATTGVQGIVVTIAERSSISSTVNQNGEFTLTGVPSGSFTLVFTLDGKTIGEIRINDVQQNQGVRLSVTLTVTVEVVLVKEERDRVAFSGSCPRGPGFWCQNKDGKNPNLSASEFQEFAEKAADMLKAAAELDTAEEVSAAVCNTGNQFRRHLASLALNLAARTVTTSTPLKGEQSGYATVGAAFNAAVAHLSGSARLSGSDQDLLKDVMDRINNAQNIEACNQVPEEDEETEEETPPTPPAPGQTGKMSICHIPSGNPNARHTLSIDASAWPAHQGHCAQGTCDYIGSCR